MSQSMACVCGHAGLQCIAPRSAIPPTGHAAQAPRGQPMLSAFYAKTTKLAARDASHHHHHLLLPATGTHLLGRRRFSPRQCRTRVMTAAIEGETLVEEAPAAAAGEEEAVAPAPGPAAAEQGEPAAEATQEGSSRPAPNSAPRRVVSRQRTVRKPVTLKAEELVKDQMVPGKVRSIQQYGCFVDIGAFTDGLVHISELSDQFVHSVADVVSVGQDVTVRVIEVDLDKGRIALSLKEPGSSSKEAAPAAPSGRRDAGAAGAAPGKPSPGAEARRPPGTLRGRGRRGEGAGGQAKSGPTYKKGQVLKGTVRSITTFGVFLELAPGVEGLCHISELGFSTEDSRIEDTLSAGQEVECRVLGSERSANGERISLTMKAEVDLDSINKALAGPSKKGAAVSPFEAAFRRSNLVIEKLRGADELKKDGEPKAAATKAEEEVSATAEEEVAVKADEEVAAKAEEEATLKEVKAEEKTVAKVEAENEAGVAADASSNEEGVVAVTDEASVDAEGSEVVEEAVVAETEAEVVPAEEEKLEAVEEVKGQVKEPKEEKLEAVEEVKAQEEEAKEEVVEEVSLVTNTEAAVEDVVSEEETVLAAVTVSKGEIDSDDETYQAVKAVVEAAATGEEMVEEAEQLVAAIEAAEQNPAEEEKTAVAEEEVVPPVAAVDETGEDVEAVAKAAEAKVEEEVKAEAVEEVQAEEAAAAAEPTAEKEALVAEPPVAPVEEKKSEGISAAIVKVLREETGSGMMACKKALQETGGDIDKARELLRKKGLAGADKKASRLATEGGVGSYIHDRRIGVLVEVNCETDFVARGEKFRELVQDIAMQVAANPNVRYVATTDVSEEFIAKEKEIEMGKEDLASKPEAIRSKIVDGRISKRLGELALMEQPYIRDDKVKVKDVVKSTVAALGENIQLRRFVRFNLGEGLQKRVSNLAEEVAAQTAAAAPKADAPAPPPPASEPAPVSKPAVAVSPAAVKSLREETGAGMMDCKKALQETAGDVEAARDYLRKKGLAGAEKKAGRVAAEGAVGSYIHDGRIGVLVEVNCETDFVARGEKFRDLVQDIAMQVAACPAVEYVDVSQVPEELVVKEREIEMGKEDLASKPEAIRSKIVEGRLAKLFSEKALLEQAYIRDDKVKVKDVVKQAIAAVGENIQVRRFERFNLGEGLEKKVVDFAAEVAAQSGAK